jgi:hypothetical protein
VGTHFDEDEEIELSSKTAGRFWDLLAVKAVLTGSLF